MQPRLVWAHHLRDLLRLTEVIDRGSQIQSPQRHAEQEPQPGHNAVAIADADSGLGQVQLEQADVLKCGRVGRPVEKRCETLATADVTCLRGRTELAGIHVLDHPLAQRADAIGFCGPERRLLRDSNTSEIGGKAEVAGAPLKRPAFLHNPMQTISPR